MTCDHDSLRSAHPDGLCVLCDLKPQKTTNDRVLKAGHAAKKERLRRGRIKAEKSLAEFVRQSWHVLEPITELEWSWHIESQANHIQFMLEQWMGRREFVKNDLIINVPPGSLKSRILSVCAPAWMWLDCNEPSWTVLCMSGSDTIAMRDARYTRDLITSKWYVDTFTPHWTLERGGTAVSHLVNDKRGVRHAQTSKSAVTGQRYDAILNDDPNDVKDISERLLVNAIDAWKAAGNRLNDLRKAVRIIIQQRTHENDLTGYLLSQKTDTLDHLCIPMEYTDATCACGEDNCDTYIGKGDPRVEEGEVLHPTRNTPKVLEGEKLRLGSLGTAGQLNQRPTPIGGGIFKNSFWGRFAELPRDRRGYLLTDTCIMSVDSTFGGRDRSTGKAKGSSRVGIVVIATKGANRYVLDVVAKKMTFTETIAEINRLYKKHVDLKLNEPLIRKLVIEEKGNGAAIIDTLTSSIPGIVGINPTSDKASRANAVHPQCEAGNVMLLSGEPWIEEFEHEMGVFPNGKYDDIVDALTQALNDLIEVSGVARAEAGCQL